MSVEAKYFEQLAEIHKASAEYYRKQLVDAHALIGRLLHQISEFRDSVNLTQYYPTENINHKRSVINPNGGMAN